MNLDNYWFPYQKKWLDDKSKIKVWEKSRRIGATYVQSYEDVIDCVAKKVPDVWFSSSDESAAREYIGYCEQWVRLLNIAAKYHGNVIVDSENDIKAYVIEFSNGAKINALSSNPKGFRSKGGKVVLDEFAHHAKQEDLWAAAKPCITWNYPLRILSTHNGQNCRFYKFVDDIKTKQSKWSLHSTPIQLAVKEGLVDKIYGRETTKKEKHEWLEEQRVNCFDEQTWLQEYCCEAMDETTAFLPYELIYTCELDNLYKELESLTGDLYVGMDIGRKKDLTVIWVLEKLGNVKYTRMVKIIEKTPFRIQEQVLANILKLENLRRCCIDATGLGAQLAESAVEKYGHYRVEGINFNAKVKEELAYNLRTNFEDRTVYIPSHREIRDDLHSVRKVITTSGHIRFDVEKSDVSGHADRFWALALALHAAQSYKEPFTIETRHRWEADDMMKGFCDDIDWSTYY
ncbi:MAG: terminase family protein [bacterium]